MTPSLGTSTCQESSPRNGKKTENKQTNKSSPYCPSCEQSLTVIPETVKSKWISMKFIYLLGLHPQHMEVPRLGVELELYTTATATPDLNRVCNLHHSSRQRRILNPLSEARDQIYVPMDTRPMHFPEPQRELQEFYFKCTVFAIRAGHQINTRCDHPQGIL